MPPRCEVNKVLERSGFENKTPIYDGGRIIVEERHLGLKAESRCSTRKHLATCGVEELELQNEGCRFHTAGALYVTPHGV